MIPSRFLYPMDIVFHLTAYFLRSFLCHLSHSPGCEFICDFQIFRVL
ncbi:hypothetical protein EVA_14563 [gut metagenome]|uniref:Uncharacterized protein n=1 Tax=gut metagenome TaxID=749906 RepID=J9FQU6_9ZZZZ